MNIFEKAVIGQLEAYNAHDVEEFLQWYTEDIKGIDLDTDTILFEGKQAMREIYTVKFQNEDLYCNVVNRMILNRTIVDHEHVTLEKDKVVMQAIAVYSVDENGLIDKVSFSKGKL